MDEKAGFADFLRGDRKNIDYELRPEQESLRIST